MARGRRLADETDQHADESGTTQDNVKRDIWGDRVQR
jgi:hypothetical protein